jgi:hypothetical protein
MGLEEIRKMRSELAEKIQKEGKALLAEEFRKFFDAHPEVEAIRWEQYTPYFNDGDACVFSVHDFCVRTKDMGEEGKDERHSEEWGRSAWELKGEALEEDFRRLCKEAHDDDVLLALFGDHVQVTASRTGFDVDEFSHD